MKLYQKKKKKKKGRKRHKELKLHCVLSKVTKTILNHGDFVHVFVNVLHTKANNCSAVTS